MKRLIVAALALLISCLVLACAEPNVDRSKEYTCGDYRYSPITESVQSTVIDASGNIATVTTHEVVGAMITRYTGSDEALFIPSELDGIKVTAISGVAFYFCDSLQTVSVPDGVTYIGGSAFWSCDNLASATLPDSVTEISGNPFYQCGSLDEIRVSVGNPYLSVVDGVLFSKPDRCLICYPEGLSASSYSIPRGIVTIGTDAFFKSHLSSVIIPDSVTTIEEFAFLACDLTSVTIPESVISMGSNPFTRCSNLTRITVSKDSPYLAVIDGVLFSKPDKRLICYPADLQATAYAIPQGIKEIGRSAFCECGNLTSVIIPNSVTTIDDIAFCNCDSLTSVTIPDSVTTIGRQAFYNCDSLTSVIIPDSVTTIDYEAFRYCDSLTSVTIPGSVTSIGSRAFADCPNVTLYVSHDSYAARYCKENGLNYEYTDSLDWLN